MFHSDATKVSCAKLSSLLKQYKNKKTGVRNSKEMNALFALVNDSRGNPKDGMVDRSAIQTALGKGSRREKLFNNPLLSQDGSGTDDIIAQMGRLYLRPANSTAFEMKEVPPQHSPVVDPVKTPVSDKEDKNTTPPDEEDLALQWLRDKEQSTLSAVSREEAEIRDKGRTLERDVLDDNLLKVKLKHLYDICLVSTHIRSESKRAESDKICERINNSVISGMFSPGWKGSICAALRHHDVGSPLLYEGHRYNLGDRDRRATEILKEYRKKCSPVDQYICCTLLKMSKANPVSPNNVSRLIAWNEAIVRGNNSFSAPPRAVLGEEVAKEWLLCVSQMYPLYSVCDLAMEIMTCRFIPHPRDLKVWVDKLQENGFQGEDLHEVIQLAHVFKDPEIISRWKKAAQDNGLGDSIEEVTSLLRYNFKNPEDISLMRGLLKENGFDDSVEKAAALASAFSDFSPPIEPAVTAWIGWIKQKNGNIAINGDGLCRVVGRFSDALGKREAWANNEFLALSDRWVSQWEKYGGAKFSLDQNALYDIANFIQMTRMQRIDLSHPESLLPEQGMKMVADITINRKITSLTHDQQEAWKGLPGCSKQVWSGSRFRPDEDILQEERVKAWFQVAGLFNKTSHEEVIRFAREQIANGMTEPDKIPHPEVAVGPGESKDDMVVDPAGEPQKPAVVGSPGGSLRPLFQGIMSDPEVVLHLPDKNEQAMGPDGQQPGGRALGRRGSDSGK